MHKNRTLEFAKQLIVSCQAPEDDVFHSPEDLAKFAIAAQQGGAAGIRANDPMAIRAIRSVVDLPIIGIQKTPSTDGGWLITGSFEAARDLVEAGADIVALDCSIRGQKTGALERIRQIKTELKVSVMADIATLEEALAAQNAGADLVSTTLRGYTSDTSNSQVFEPSFVELLSQKLTIPVVAEGRISNPEQAQEALTAGAFAVVVGTAITSPQELTRRFASSVKQVAELDSKFTHFIGIDLGGTNTKAAIVTRSGELLHTLTVPTPATLGRTVLLNHLKQIAKDVMTQAKGMGLTPSALGIATAGWVDFSTGQVAYATENLPGWTGTPIAEELSASTQLPVAVENDANALALAEKQFGVGKAVQDFVCITLGTGVGGGCSIGGKLNRGSHSFANALGHITLVPEGLPCTCGKRGCLEAYANSSALLRFAEGNFTTAEEVITAAHKGDAVATRAIQILAGFLATGLASITHILDPEMIILSGGLVENNPMLLENLERELRAKVSVWEHRKMQIQISKLGYFSGVLGAVAASLEKLARDSVTQRQTSLLSPTSLG